jgi:hypothetical protein
MPTPTFHFNTGTTPTNADTKWSLWAKIVIRLSQLTGKTGYLPSINDSKRELIVKALRLFPLL